MSDVLNTPLSEIYENIKYYQKYIDENDVEPFLYTTKLDYHQFKCVKWILDRETNNDLIKSDGTQFSGGILAYEIDRLKQIEMLCCILVNKAPEEFYNSTPSSRINFLSLSQKRLFQNEEMPFESKRRVLMNPNMNNDDLTIEHEIVDIPQELIPKKYIKCSMCENAVLEECTNYEYLFETSAWPYLCADCQTQNDQFQCKATLIIVPDSSVNLWVDEINKLSTSGLNYFVYEGVYSDGSIILPHYFKWYDIVIISYRNILKETKYFDLENQRLSSLRHLKKYMYPKSPLLSTKWWRICFDQYLDYQKILEITSRFKSVHKWVIISSKQESLNDFYDFMKFLDICPYNDHKQLVMLTKHKNDLNVVYRWLSKFIWFNSREDVNFEFNLPTITTEINRLSLSEYEKYFYNELIKSYKKKSIRSINKYIRLSRGNSIPKHKHVSILDEITSHLNYIIHACTHPEDEAGQFLQFECSKTMEDVIEEIRDECSDFLRLIVINKLDIFKKSTKYLSAANHFKDTMKLLQVFKQKSLKIDPHLESYEKQIMNKIDGECNELYHSSNNSDFKKNGTELENSYLNGANENVNEIIQIESNITQYESIFENKLRILLYLENAKKENENSTEIDSCLICCNYVTDWAVLPCGHSTCPKCFITLYDNSDYLYIACPMCRSNCQVDAIKCVRNYPEDEMLRKVKGSFSNKIENIILKFFELIAEDPKVKVLVLSSWKISLRCLANALRENSINFKVVNLKNELYESQTDFKTEEKVNAFLLDVNVNFTGLYLFNLSRVFFMEPIIISNTNKIAEVDQMISTLGKYKKIICHHFIVDDTIESEITNITLNDEFNKQKPHLLHNMMPMLLNYFKYKI